MAEQTDLLGVSRETIEKLRSLEELLIKWNPAINLVSKSTIANVWERHIIDSAQIYALAPHRGHWVDLGSGGGFPGLVIACMSSEIRSDLRVTLVESDQRKSTFLRMVSTQLALNATVVCQRIEQTQPLSADILSARALAPLPALLAFAQRHLAPGGVCLFPKGASWKQEVEAARKDWHFEVENHKSITDDDGAILAVKAISHV